MVAVLVSEMWQDCNVWTDLRVIVDNSKHAYNQTCWCMYVTHTGLTEFDTHNFVQSLGVVDFHIITLRSYEHDARMFPNLGCAHATCHTGPWWPLSSASALLFLRE